MDRRSRLICFSLPYPFHMKRSLLWLGCWILFNGAIDLGVQNGIRGDLCFVWYNVENLFYPGDDSIPGDDEFTPNIKEGFATGEHITWKLFSVVSGLVNDVEVEYDQSYPDNDGTFKPLNPVSGTEALNIIRNLKAQF